MHISIKKSISFLLVVTSLVWLGCAFYGNRLHLQDMWAQFSVRNLIFLGIGTFIATVAIGLLMPIFQILLTHNTTHTYKTSFVARLFYSGQIVSYVPGRFLGLTYLIAETHGTIPALTMFCINVELILMIIVFNLIVSFSIAAYYNWGFVLSVLCFGAGQLFFVLYLKNNLVRRLILAMKRFLPEGMMVRVDNFSFRPFHNEAVAKIILFLIAHWLLYLTSWHLFQYVFDSLVDKNMILLCANYALSWVIGFVCLLTPGGWGIREASFVFLSAGLLPQYQTVFFAVFLRIWLIAIDFILFALSCLFDKSSKEFSL